MAEGKDIQKISDKISKTSQQISHLDTCKISETVKELLQNDLKKKKRCLDKQFGRKKLCAKMKKFGEQRKQGKPPTANPSKKINLD